MIKVSKKDKMLKWEQAFYLGTRTDKQVVYNRISQIAYSLCRREKAIIDCHTHFWWRKNWLGFYRCSTETVVVSFLIDLSTNTKNKGSTLVDKLVQAVTAEFPDLQDGWCNCSEVEATYDLTGVKP